MKTRLHRVHNEDVVGPLPLVRSADSGVPEGTSVSEALGPADVLVRAQGTECSRFGDEFLLLNPAGDVLFGLNAFGAFVWELLDGRQSVGELAFAVATRYSIGADSAKTDLLKFFRELASRSLVERIAAPAR